MTSIKKKFCFLIGEPVSRSLSPRMHSAGYAALGITDQFNYEAKQVGIKDLKQALERLRQDDVAGASVTMPLKQEIMQFLDQVDERARKINAVNTVVNKDGQLIGSNTDWIGVTEPLKQKKKIEGSKVALIGAGGAARAACFGLTAGGAIVTVFNRSVEKAVALAREFSCSVASLEHLKDLDDFDVVINATSLGMSPNDKVSPLPGVKILSKLVVFDLVYIPHCTKLIDEAQSAGAEIIFGIEMLLHQGAAQFELFTGQKAPIEKMRQALTS